VSQQQNRAPRAGAAEPSHEIVVARRRSQHRHVPGGKAGREESPRHRFGGGRRVAVLVGRIDADQLSEHVPGELLIGRRILHRETHHRDYDRKHPTLP